MNISELSIKRPIFMSCVLVALLVVGLVSFKKLPVDLFPDVTFPIVTVTVPYPGSGPKELEALVAKPLEEELGGLAGVKTLRSINSEGVCIVVAEFSLETDIKYAEQQVRDRVSGARRKLPSDILEPVIRKVDPADQPMMVVALKAPLKAGELYDLANETLKPQIESIPNVGRIEILGGRKREIQVLLDRRKLRERQISVSQVVQSLRNSGVNLPSGKVDQSDSELVFRTLGEFNTIDSLKDFTVSFFGNEVPVRLKDLGQVSDSLEDQKTKAFLNGEDSVFFYIYKQSRANTIEVSRAITKKIAFINEDLKTNRGPTFSLDIVQDTARYIKNNVDDVYESIAIGVVLTVLVVFLFLGSLRSTLITGLAIPVSLIGGMALFQAAGLTINVMSLLALSLAVGLLIDDAIVVRENIFRHQEMGKSAKKAALDGTTEVALAVVAVTLCVLAVFGPIAFLSGVVGQFFKSFGLGVCFVMIISLFDALSNAPMMSAYFGGSHSEKNSKGIMARILLAFDQFQSRMEDRYEKLLKVILKNPSKTFALSMVVVLLLGSTVLFIPKTFLPPQESGEFAVSLELPEGTRLDKMTSLGLEVETLLRKNSEVKTTVLTVGDANGKANISNFYVTLRPFGVRKKKTATVKAEIREALKPYSYANPVVKDVDMVAGGMRPFTVNIRGENMDDLRLVTKELYERLKSHPALSDPEISDKVGAPEFQIKVDDQRAQSFGVTAVAVGSELRAQVEGVKPAKFRENGLEYDIRVRLAENQRDLEKDYNDIFVPNLNYRLVALKDFATGEKKTGLATINRENRSRYISIGADIAPNGPGMGAAISDINKWVKSGEIKLPPGVTYRFVGQAENFQELGVSMIQAAVLGIVFIFLVLASLYESVFTPFVIMLVIPLAIVGGFFGLFVFGGSLDLFSMIGCIMLMGLATKNSIILVDYIHQKVKEGMGLDEAIIISGKTRLRPILMTSLALVAGMVPVAIGLNEASSQRTSLGIAVIGGVTVSTFLTLLVIPSVYRFVESTRLWFHRRVGRKLVNQQGDEVRGAHV